MVSPAVCASHGSGYQDVANVTAPSDDEVDQVSVFGLGMHSGCFMDLWLFEERIHNGQLSSKHTVSRSPLDRKTKMTAGFPTIKKQKFIQTFLVVEDSFWVKRN